MDRPLSPIERMIDAATGFGPALPTGGAMLTLRCPNCGREKESRRDAKIDPLGAVLLVTACPPCGRKHGRDVHYFDKDGKELEL